MSFFSEVAVAGATGVAGAAGVDVLRAGGRRGLLNGKYFLTVSLAAAAVIATLSGAAVLATLSMLMGKKKSTATSSYLYHIPCLLMQVLLDLWIFRILASLLGVFHLIIQQIKTSRSP